MSPQCRTVLYDDDNIKERTAAPIVIPVAIPTMNSVGARTESAEIRLLFTINKFVMGTAASKKLHKTVLGPM